MYNADNLNEKLKFKIIKQEFLKDQVIFGVLTASNFVGQIPPVQICDQNHDGGPAWWSKFQNDAKQKSKQDSKIDETNCDELSQNY